MRKLPAFIFLFCIYGLVFSQTNALPEGVRQITSVEGITEYQFANGMKLLLFPDRTKQTVTVNITYLVGSMHENYGETGMAHLLEHMLFRGTPNRPDIRTEMTGRGARPNGTTWLDRTNYFETIAASDANLDWALALEADRMLNSFVAKKDLDQEMTVVRNEFESGENSPQNVLLERIVSTAYLWHNYGNTTIGARSDIENVPIERLQAFYRLYYQPDNAVLLIAGNFDSAKAVQMVHQYFGPIPRPSRQLPQFYTSEPIQDGERLVTLRRVGDVQLIGAAYHVPAGSHPDFAALDIMSWILSDTPSGRLYKSLVETKKATSVYGFNFQLRQPGVTLYAAEVLKEASLDPAKETMLQSLEGMGMNPPTAEEVERARTSILKEIELSLNSPDRVGLDLSEWIAMGDWRLFFLYRDSIRKVTPQDVQRVASTYLKQSNRTVGIFIPTEKPDRAEVPPEPKVTDLVKDYKGEAPVEAGEAFDPSTSNIESRIERISDSSGISMALLSKKTRGGSVVASMTLRFGNLESLKGRMTAADLAGQMLMRGTTKRTRQQIQDELDRLKARLTISGGATQANVSLETERENLSDVLRLIAEILRDPSLPENEFDLLKQELQAEIDQLRTEPQAVASIAFSRHMNPYPADDPRYTETPDEATASLKAASLADVKKFYKDFYGASNLQIAVIGDFDSREVSKLILDLLSNWKSPQTYRRIEEQYIKVKPVNESFETPDKANAMFIAGLNLELRDDDPDYPALTFGNYMLGGAMNSRLKVRIREKEGLSYGVGSNLNAHPLDRSGSFTSFAIYAPENAAKLEAVYKEELNGVLGNGFSAEELSVAKTGYMQARQLGRAQDRELVRKLALYLFLDRKITWDAEFEKKIESLTAEQIQSALRKQLDPSQISFFKAGDFAKSATK